MDYIKSVLKKLEDKHKLHLEFYGDNSKRLSGMFETSSKETFTWGPGNRAASVRIPTSTYHSGGKGYLEDRRPASDLEPYVACAVLIDTIALNQSLLGDLYLHYTEWKRWLPTADIE